MINAHMIDKLCIELLIITGILAGMWPCGVITWLNELFVSESKSQVYGQLHDFLKTAPITASNISRLLASSGISAGMCMCHPSS